MEKNAVLFFPKFYFRRFSSEVCILLYKQCDSEISGQFDVLDANYEKNNILHKSENYILLKGNCDFVSYANDFLSERLNFISEKTVRSYKYALEHYSFLSLDDFEKSDFIRFLALRGGSKWTRRTLEQNIKVVCIFGNWLCDNHITHRHHRLKVSRKPVRRDTPESWEIEILFDSLLQSFQSGTSRQRLEQHQRYLILRILYETGCRISEAVALFLEDVRIQSGKYFILIRGTKSESAERAVQISTELFDELNNYRNFYKLKGRLFSTKKGFQLDTSNFSSWLRHYGEKLNLSCRINPHLFRYLFIIESIKKGGDLTEIMVRLGHSDVSMTIYYFNQVRRLYPDIELSNSISILEQKKKLNAHIFNKKPKY